MPVNSEKKRRVCLVTGGARGFGQAISRRLAELGHDVAVMDVVSAAATAELVRQTGSRFLSIEADISVRQNVGEAALEICGKLGPWTYWLPTQRSARSHRCFKRAGKVGAAP